MEDKMLVINVHKKYNRNILFTMQMKHVEQTMEASIAQ